MPIRHFRRFTRILVSVLVCVCVVPILRAQGAKQSVPETAIPDSDADHVQQRNEWFFRGRIVRGKNSAELRRRAYEAKNSLRAEHATALAAAQIHEITPQSAADQSTSAWAPLGPVPLASDATGNATQNYNQVAGRATAVVIDPADSTGNTVYVGGAQAGVWKSSNAAASQANTVTWTPLTDDQATLSIGAIAIQSGNNNPANSVILAATGEADNSGDSYFGLGILRSTNAGNTWNLITTANSGALSFSGLGGTRMAFSTASSQTNTVVSALAMSSEGVVAGATSTNTMPGLYTSLDAGQTWTYDDLSDPGGATDAASATSVVYNTSAGLFFAAVRYHGFYSSPDGENWTRLATQPGSGLLSTTACPPQSTSNGQACPIYRAEVTVVPGRNEMYAWFIYYLSGELTDGGIWQSLNSGASWTQISDAGITDCGDSYGCGIEQGFYDLELLAVPNCPDGQQNCPTDSNPTDLYAGAINLYKCSLSAPASSTACANGFLNLTHVYGCDPVSAPSHMHPDQHALAYAIPTSGNDSGSDLMYFANDGGIYRTLNGFAGLTSGSCSGTNQFDDLNQNLGSMSQFVSFSEHPTDPNTLLGGTQDNGSPATAQAATNPPNLAWGNVLGGDGGYNAIDPNATSNFYASNPDIPPAGLGIQLCSSGVNCTDSLFNVVVNSNDVGGDDGDFYFPYILDPQSSTALLVGTCRVWRGARTGGGYTLLSPNFDTLGSGTCSGEEVNLVRSIAAGGPTDTNGSTVVYATTSGYGPIDGPLSTPTGGRVWVTTNATAGPSNFVDVTNNGPQGNINPNQFPISNVAMDSYDSSGQTAFVTIMGFTATPGSTSASGHVWKTTNAGVSWTDFTGNLPDSPANAVVVDSTAHMVYVGTDVGVFASSTSAPPSWTEVGPAAVPSQTGFLPNVAVTALGLFTSGGQKLLRASTYGRGIWQLNLVTTPDYQLTVSNSPLTTFYGQNAVFDGTATAVNGYANSVTMGCVAGGSAPPNTCSVSPSVLTPGSSTAFTVTAGGAVGTYNFNIQGVGADPSQITHQVPVTLNVLGFGISPSSPTSVSTLQGTTSSAVSFKITAAGSFNQGVTVSCSDSISGATCNFTPGTTVYPTVANPVSMTVTVTVPAATTAGDYPITIQATTSGAPAPLTVSFALNVIANPSFALSEPSAFPEVNAGSTGTSGSISVAAQNGFTGTVTLACSSTYGTGTCSISPTSVNSFPASATLTINGTNFSAGAYSVSVTGTSGSAQHSVTVPFNVGDYTISGTTSLSLTPGAQGKASFTLISLDSYSGKVNATCDASALPAAQCTISPANPISVASGGTAKLTAIINTPNDANPSNYDIKIDTQDTTGTPNHSLTVTLTVTPDFIVTSSTTSQTVNPGQTTGPYNLTVQPVGNSFNNPVTLSCSGLPAGAQCSFNPSAPVTPGDSAVDVVMSISTSSSTGSSVHRSRLSLWLLLPGILFGGIVLQASRKSSRNVLAFLTFVLSVWLAFVLLSCGGASTGGGGGGGSCSAPPSTPGMPTASSTTGTGTTLNWTASSATVGCTVTYTVYEGVSGATPTPLPNTTTSTTYQVIGLTAQTRYSFQVGATDAVGGPVMSQPLNLTTSGSIYTITVTGTSPGTPSDSGQSTQVTLVVN